MVMNATTVKQLHLALFGIMLTVLQKVIACPVMTVMTVLQEFKLVALQAHIVLLRTSLVKFVLLGILVQVT
jgi:hypothetical protein